MKSTVALFTGLLTVYILKKKMTFTNNSSFARMLQIGLEMDSFYENLTKFKV